MTPLYYHLVFDLLASCLALAGTIVSYRWRLQSHMQDLVQSVGNGYAVALLVGAVIGGYGFGTLNLVLSGIPEIGRSIVGALAGAIVSIEVFKWMRGISGSTGVIFVVGFTTTVVVGRIGCLLSGLRDQTHGIQTSAPWGWDFGDGVSRHPVQLYESLTMALFLIVTWIALAQRWPFFYRNGFYLMVGVYALQRFLWEFLKPYATIAGPLNLFHLVCLGLMAYSIHMMARSQNV